MLFYLNLKQLRNYWRTYNIPNRLDQNGLQVCKLKKEARKRI